MCITLAAHPPPHIKAYGHLLQGNIVEVFLSFHNEKLSVHLTPWS